ncbi:HD family hydrolase [Sedimentitalea sp. HM32M-2]|uniref:HD domain-containing protein n=1 Tax=Sedimentitalea sp. HM32M-2 TaxID=3351566 RepID=UPI0036320524
MTARLEAQIAFLREADKLKSVCRASRLIDDSRRENSAEHSWHVMLYALVLAEQAPPETRIDRVIRMLLLHDLVEVDAGDVPIHGRVDPKIAAREQAAADRLFGLLPADQAAEFRALWDEFETGETSDAQFAKALDRFQPPIANLANGGDTWRDYNVTMAQMDQRIGETVKRGAPGLWSWLRPQLQRFFSGR